MQCWGNNANGELGNGTTTASGTPQPTSYLTGDVATLVAGSQENYCAITNGGTLACWGANNYGQLGNGTTVDQHVPTAVVGLGEAVTAVSIGFDHTCAVTSDHHIWCWGQNGSFLFGPNSTPGVQSLVPLLVR